MGTLHCVALETSGILSFLLRPQFIEKLNQWQWPRFLHLKVFPQTIILNTTHIYCNHLFLYQGMGLQFPPRRIIQDVTLQEVP